ncbi:PREDICTED: uncharacterized protein LOC104817218 [Tarenaya hassleriana]|uniref:uncharacterized protein LOC104817218 n=1 Tax=Tarenaya hassleriana TaxID=28532 RepID=UPI00053CA4FF|nr:PREDICTED: uncharacterized protein LOC104817218 [Tarenaya hassleriana]
MVSQGMVSLAKSLCTTVTVTPRVHLKNPKMLQSTRNPRLFTSCHLRLRDSRVFCTKLSQWESSPIIRAPAEEAGGGFLEKTENVFESIRSETEDEASSAASKAEEDVGSGSSQNSAQFQVLKWPIWLLGPSVLLTTGMAPTLWLPLSSVFLGPNVVSLFSLIGLDCIFNLGATLFLLMADSCARPKDPSESCKSKPPFSYRFWNTFAAVAGLVVPLFFLIASQRGLALLQPPLPFISSGIMFFPYFILLAVQMLTEMLTWHWQSPVWLVTPVVYESYRVLQLMRGLKLGSELNAPVWVVHTLRGLVSWWVLILGMQLMRVAWFAGFTSRSRRQKSHASE